MRLFFILYFILFSNYLFASDNEDICKIELHKTELDKWILNEQFKNNSCQKNNLENNDSQKIIAEESNINSSAIPMYCLYKFTSSSFFTLIA